MGSSGSYCRLSSQVKFVQLVVILQFYSVNIVPPSTSMNGSLVSHCNMWSAKTIIPVEFLSGTSSNFVLRAAT